MHSRTKEVLEYLDASDRVLDDAVATLPEAVRGHRPAAECWSAAEILEHLSLVEGAIAGMLSQQVSAARIAGLGAESGTDPVIPTVPIGRLLNRQARISASERSHPKGSLGWAAGREALAAARARTRALLSASEGLALSEVIVPHPVLGPLNVYQWIVFLGAHEQRHAAQISEAGKTLAGVHALG